jgi:TRAP-type mannitol/chloroaromatic compound transport system permease large subunit
VLGTALDGISMIVLTSAVVLPMIQKVGFDLVWFGIFIVLMVEIAEVTPPVGFNLFVLQNMTGRDSNYIALASVALLRDAGPHHSPSSTDVSRRCVTCFRTLVMVRRRNR